MKTQPYKTVLVLITASIILFFYFKKDYILYISLSLGILCTVSDSIAKAIDKYWMLFGKTLGNFNAKILLSLFYIILIIPISGIRRISTSKKAKQKKSNWTTQNQAKKIDFLKLW